MDRDLYIKYRLNNDINIVYEFYKEHFDKKKHVLFLSFNQVVHLLQNTGYNIRSVMDDSIEYFDNKFTLVKIYKGNDIISYA